MKKEITMRNWLLTKLNGQYNLTGTADRHPKLGKDVYISWTSTLEKGEVKDDILYYETKNSLYKCPLKYMCKEPFRYANEEFVKDVYNNLSDTDLDKIIRAEIDIRDDKLTEYTEKIKALVEKGQIEIDDYYKNEERKLTEKVKDKPNSIYLEVTNIGEGDILAYNIENNDNIYLGIVHPQVHSGMFQDSILYMVYDILDFRYFPRFNGLDTYHWSDTIKEAYIKNDTSEIISFNGEPIMPGELKTFDNSLNREGLISPDVVNGKNIFSNEER